MTEPLAVGLASTDTSRHPEHGTGGGLSAREVTGELRRSKNDPALGSADVGVF